MSRVMRNGDIDVKNVFTLKLWPDDIYDFR